MSGSVHEQVLARVKALLLAGATAAGQRVSRGRVDAFSPDEVPSINVRRSQGEHSAHSAGLDHGAFEFDLDFFVRGDDWETTSDALHMEAHALLAVDAPLAELGQGLRCIRTQPAPEQGDEVLGRLTATYQIRRLVRINDLTKGR